MEIDYRSFLLKVKKLRQDLNEMTEAIEATEQLFKMSGAESQDITIYDNPEVGKALRIEWAASEQRLVCLCDELQKPLIEHTVATRRACFPYLQDLITKTLNLED